TPAPSAGPAAPLVPVAPPLLLAVRRVALTGPPNAAEILVDLSLAHPAAGTSTDLQMHVRVTDALPQLASFLGGPAALTGTIDVVADTAGNPQLRLNLQVVPATPQLTDAQSG